MDFYAPISCWSLASGVGYECMKFAQAQYDVVYVFLRFSLGTYMQICLTPEGYELYTTSLLQQYHGKSISVRVQSC
jgi:hypothetical protein